MPDKKLATEYGPYTTSFFLVGWALGGLIFGALGVSDAEITEPISGRKSPANLSSVNSVSELWLGSVIHPKNTRDWLPGALGEFVEVHREKRDEGDALLEGGRADLRHPDRNAPAAVSVRSTQRIFPKQRLNCRPNCSSGPGIFNVRFLGACNLIRYTFPRGLGRRADVRLHCERDRRPAPV